MAAMKGRQKLHECTSVGKLQTAPFMMAALYDVALGSEQF
jgi:hypothetical protein